MLAELLSEHQAVSIDIPATAADKALTNRPCLLFGWSLRETTGAGTAAAEFFNGGSAAAPRVGEQALASAGTGGQGPGGPGIFCDGGLFLHVVSGTLAGCVYVKL